MFIKISRLFAFIFFIFFVFFTYENFFSKKEFEIKEIQKKEFFNKEKLEVTKNSNMFIYVWSPKNKNSQKDYKTFILIKKLESIIFFFLSSIFTLFLSIFYKRKKNLWKIFENNFKEDLHKR